MQHTDREYFATTRGISIDRLRITILVEFTPLLEYLRCFLSRLFVKIDSFVNQVN